MHCDQCLQETDSVIPHGVLMTIVCHCWRMLADAITATCMTEQHKMCMLRELTVVASLCLYPVPLNLGQI